MPEHYDSSDVPKEDFWAKRFIAAVWDDITGFDETDKIERASNISKSVGGRGNMADDSEDWEKAKSNE